MSKVNLPQGMRDFNAETVYRRNYILNTIKNVFELYGYEPLETPAMENLTTLTGKYGEEGDKLMFKVLNNGLTDEKNAEKAQSGFIKALSGISSPELTERALKYDLTIPFARYVAMNRNTLVLPFKRYQVQPVWRADRPQKGRYREFTQCDADVVGSKSLWNEVELAHIYHQVFTALQLNSYTLKLNNRKFLAALAAVCGGEEKFIPITIAIDKLDKIGIEKVKESLITSGLEKEAVQKIEDYLQVAGSNEEKLISLQVMFIGNTAALQAIDEMKFILENCKEVNLVLDLTLARGLNYYTGAIFEVAAPANVKMGSIGGGGRYDDLTGMFGVNDIAGVGVSFGVDRIYDVIDELHLFPENEGQVVRVLFFNMGQEQEGHIFETMQKLRKENIGCEMYHEPSKLEKQFKYAEKKNIPFAVIIGPEELKNGKANVKELSNGKQEKIAINNLSEYLKQKGIK